MQLQDTLETLPGEGEVKTITRVFTRRDCEECGESAHFKATYLLAGNARGNRESKAYGRDDCSWCSDLDVFLCRDCLKNGWHPRREGYESCSLFPANAGFAHMFLYWKEVKS